MVGRGAVVDPDLQITGGRSSSPSKKGGGQSPKNVFSALRASVWSNNEGGGWVPGPLP